MGIDEIFNDQSQCKELPLHFQNLKQTEENDRLLVKYVDCPRLNKIIVVKPFYKPISKIININYDPSFDSK